MTQNIKIKAMDKRWFDACVNKVEMYLKTKKTMALPQYDNPHITEYEGTITFWNDFDDVLCFDNGTRKENIKALVWWLLNGAVDPLGHYGTRK